MSDILKSMRIKHYIKNFLILVPFVFGVLPEDYSMEQIVRMLSGFVSFSFSCSIVYIYNDWCDREKDRKHPEKKNRPIASGRIQKKQVYIMLAVLFILIEIIYAVAGLSFQSEIILCSYLLLNIFYSRFVKKIVLLDIVMLSFFYVIRVYYGAALAGVSVSPWLFLTVLCLALYLSGAKRYGELEIYQEEAAATREVLSGYSREYLNSIMQIFLGMTLVFYALWAVTAQINMLLTVPVVIFSLMRYQYDVLIRKESDPAETVYQDKWLLLMIVLYVFVIFASIMWKQLS